VTEPQNPTNQPRELVDYNLFTSHPALVETLAVFGLDAIEVSERDILDGIALAAAELPEPEEGAARPVETDQQA